MKPRGRGLVFARAVCGGGGGDDRASSLFERCAAVCRACGRSVAEAPSLPLVFAGRSLGVLLLFGAIGPRPWIRRWIVGLTRSRGTFPERDRRALALLCRVPGSERFFGARLPVHAWRGSEFDRAAFSVLLWSKQTQTGESSNEAREPDAVAKGRSWRRLGPIPSRMQAPFRSFQSCLAPGSGPGHASRRLLDACRRVGKK